MSRRATAAHVSSDPATRGRGRGLAGLIDVLDRADGAPQGRRPQARRASAHRAGGPRSGAVRTVPLRSVQPAPMARAVPAPRAYAVPEPERVPAAGLSDLVRRAAMWGAGPRGEYLAWRGAPQPTPSQPAPSQPAPSQPAPSQPAPSQPTRPQPTARRRARVRSLVRRLSLWGSGPGGKYLAWGGPAFPDRPTVVDPPVVLREMPSTPTIQPAAPSPAAALLPRAPASSAGTRGMPPVPRGAVAVPGVRPGGPPERSRATGWPSQSHPSPAATGLVRARGDPLSWPARGSPPPARRSRSPGSARSSFP